LFTIFTPLALEGVVCIANSLFIEREELTECINGKVTFCIFLFVDDSGRQGLLVRLSLEDLLLNRSSRDEAIDEA